MIYLNILKETTYFWCTLPFAFINECSFLCNMSIYTRRQEGALILGSDGGKALASDVLLQLVIPKGLLVTKAKKSWSLHNHKPI
jgi:hypothetical protein